MTIAQIGTILVRLVNDHEIFPPECGFKKYFDYIHDNNQAVKYVRHLSNLFQLCKVPVTGKRILDAGCGYGLTSLVTRLLGAKEVYGVDLKTDRIMKFGSYLRQLWFNIDGITPVFGDVLMRYWSMKQSHIMVTLKNFLLKHDGCLKLAVLFIFRTQIMRVIR